jgi:L-threonylcarbamoyladenylate synthase
VSQDPAAAATDAVRAAATLLRSGGLVAFPTETVYGLGAHALDAAAVARIFAAKGRPADNPLIVHLAAPEAMGQVAAEVTPLAEELATRWWPGPMTLVLEARPDVPSVTRGGLDTVAVRVPAHPLALALLREADVPVAAPSANRSGRPSPTTAADVRAELGDAVDAVIDGGPCHLGVESTVVDARGPRPVVLREGLVTREDLGVDDDAAPTPSAASPGTRYRHYAPRLPVHVAAPGDGPTVAAALVAAGRRVGLVAPGARPPGVVSIARFHGADELAAQLYRSLRRAEAAGVDVLVVEGVPDRGTGRAVMDRLRRAAGLDPSTGGPAGT